MEVNLVRPMLGLSNTKCIRYPETGLASRGKKNNKTGFVAKKKESPSFTRTKAIFSSSDSEKRRIIKKLKEKRKGIRRLKEKRMKDCDYRLDVWDSVKRSYIDTEYENEELRLITLAELREDYISRLKDAALPFAAETSDIIAEYMVKDTQLVRDLVEIIRRITVETIERISAFAEESKQTFLWNGMNYLLSLRNDFNFLCHVPVLKRIIGVKRFRDNPLLIPSNPEELSCIVDEIDRQRLKRVQRILEDAEQLHGPNVSFHHSYKKTWVELDELLKRRRQRLIRDSKTACKLVPLLKGVTISGNSRNCFQRHDQDGDGMLSYKEFLRAVERLGQLPLDTDDERDWLLRQCDPQNAQWVSYDAFGVLCLRAKRGEIPTKVIPQIKSRTAKFQPNMQCFKETKDKEASIHKRMDLIKAEIKDLTKRRQLLQEEQLQIQEENNANCERMSSCIKDDEYAMRNSILTRKSNFYTHSRRPHIENVIMRQKTFQAITGKLTHWRNEITQSISILWEKEMKLKKEHDQLEEEEKRIKEIRQNILEEEAMQDAENQRKKMERIEQQARLEAEKESRRIKELEYRENLRRKKRNEARNLKERKNRYSVTLQCLFRRHKAEKILKLKKSALRQLEARVPCLFGLKRNSLCLNTPFRNGFRITPSIILIQKSSNKIPEILNALSFGFWKIFSPEEEIEKNIQWFERLESLNRDSCGIIVQVNQLNLGWIKLLQLTIEGLFPRPLLTVLGDNYDHPDSFPTGSDENACAIIIESCKYLLCDSENSKMFLGELLQVGAQKTLPKKILLLVTVISEILFSGTERSLLNTMQQYSCNNNFKTDKVNKLCQSLLKNAANLIGQIRNFDLSSSSFLRRSNIAYLTSFLLHQDWPQQEYRQSPAISILTDWTWAALHLASNSREYLLPSRIKSRMLDFVDLVNPEVNEVLISALLETQLAFDAQKEQSLFVCTDKIILYSPHHGFSHLGLREVCQFLAANTASESLSISEDDFALKIASIGRLHTSIRNKNNEKPCRNEADMVLEYPMKHSNMPTVSEEAIIRCGYRIDGAQHIVSLSTSDDAKLISITATNLFSCKTYKIEHLDQEQILGSKAGTMQGFEEILSRLRFIKGDDTFYLPGCIPDPMPIEVETD